MANAFNEINKKIASIESKVLSIKCGTVTSTSPFKCKLDGDDASNTYLKLKGYSPVVGDRVAFLVYNKKYIMIGAYE